MKKLIIALLAFSSVAIATPTTVGDFPVVPAQLPSIIIAMVLSLQRCETMSET